MRNLKKILALVLALMMVLSTMAIASAADFVDAAEIEHTEAVNVMAGLGILSGKPAADGEFKFDPNGTLNRGEAAKIIAYIMTGDADYVVAMAKYMDHPFADVVGHWSEPFVAYCYNEGFVTGLSATNYGVKSELTGAAFAKLLLCAAGINTNENYVAANNWVHAVNKDLVGQKLLTGLSDLDLNKAISRQDACQLAWNVMNWSPAGSTIEYIVKEGETTYYEGTDVLTATLIADALELDVDTKITSVGSLADSIFGVSSVETKDAFGRTTETFTSTLLPTMNVVLADAVAAHSYVATANVTITNAATLVAAVNDVLKLTTPLTGDAATMHINSKTAAYGNIEIGDTVEVYASNGVISKVVVVRESIGTAVLGDKIEEGTNKGLYNWTIAGAKTIAAKDAYVENANYLVIKGDDDAALSVEIPTTIVAAKISGAEKADYSDSAYLIVNGQKLVKNGAYKAVTTDLDFAETYDFFIGTNGYLMTVAETGTVEVEVEKEWGYAYLLDAEAKVSVTNASDDTLLAAGKDYKWSIVAKAQIALTNGETEIVDLSYSTTKDANGVVTALTLSGKTHPHAAGTVELMDSGKIFDGWTFVKYEIEADGTYTLSKVTPVANTVLTKGQAAITCNGTKYATSETVWTSYVFNTATKVFSATEKVGFANFVTGSTYAALAKTVTGNANLVASIDTFAEYTPSTTTETDYAYYLGAGDYDVTADSNTYKFLINGEVVEYFLAGELVDSEDEPVELAAGKVYELVLDSGKLAVADIIAWTAENAEITYIDAGYILTTSALYLADGCGIYNVENGANTVDTLEKGDKISYIVVDGKVDVIFIVHAK